MARPQTHFVVAGLMLALLLALLPMGSMAQTSSEVFAEALATEATGVPLAGPNALDLGQAAGVLTVYKAGLNVADFVAHAEFVNPEIVESSGEWEYDEGCLSVPGLSFPIVRPKVVTVHGLDLDGREVVLEGDELMGRLIQHEIDHLDGVLLLDRLEPAAKKAAMRELRQILDGEVALPAAERSRHL